MPTHLSILVSVASPLDYARYRHTSLYFEFENEEGLKSALMEVVGSPGFFSFSERVNIELPVSSTSMYHIRSTDHGSQCRVHFRDPLFKMVERRLIKCRYRARDPRLITTGHSACIINTTDYCRDTYYE